MASGDYFNQYMGIDKEIENLISTQPGEEQATIDEIKKKRNYDEQRSSFDSTNKTLLETEKRLSAVPKDVINKTAKQGRLVTSGQINRITASEQQPLAEQLAGVSRTKQSIQEGLSAIDNEITQEVGRKKEQFGLKRGLLDTKKKTAWDAFISETQKETDAIKQAREDEMIRYQKEQDAINNRFKQDELNLARTRASRENPQPNLAENEYSALFESLLAEGKYAEAAELADYYKKNRSIIGWGKGSSDKKNDKATGAYYYDRGSDSVISPDGTAKKSTVKGGSTWSYLPGELLKSTKNVFGGIGNFLSKGNPARW